jgi:hypothetical protein
VILGNFSEGVRDNPTSATHKGSDMSISKLGGFTPATTRRTEAAAHTRTPEPSKPAAPSKDAAKSLWETAQKVGTGALGAVLPGADAAVRSLAERFREAAAQVKPEGRSFGGGILEFLKKLGPQDDTIAIFDDFGDGVTHGDNVTQVVQDNSTAEATQIRQIETGGSSGSGSLEERIANRATGLLDSTSDGIESILNSPGNIQVINQSQSISEIRVVDDMWDSVKNDPNRRGDLAEELGLPRDAEEKEIIQALVNKVDEVFEGSEEIAQAKERYDALSQQLEDKGILHVVTAGNTGDELAAWDAMGITYDEDFTNSVLFNEHTIVVAASTGGSPDGIADFSTPSDFVTLAIDGTDIPVVNGTSNGTSFAAPQVSALISEMRRINPDLTNDQIRDILARASTDTAASSQQEGAGILNPDKALVLARLTLLPNIVRSIAG